MPARNAAATIGRCLAAIARLDPAPARLDPAIARLDSAPARPDPAIARLDSAPARPDPAPANLDPAPAQPDPAPARVLVLDDGSTDATARIAAAAGAEVLSVPGEGGLGRARNLALDACRTERLAFLNADCYPAPDWLRRLSASLEAGGAAAAGGRQLEARSETLAERWKAANLRQDLGPRPLLDPDFLSGGNMLLAVERLRGTRFDPRHRVAYEDVDFCRRLRAAGATLSYEPAATVMHDHRETMRTLPRKVWSYGAPSRSVGPVRTLRDAPSAFARMHRRPADQIASALRRDVRGRNVAFVALDLYLLGASLALFCLHALAPDRFPGPAP